MVEKMDTTTGAFKTTAKTKIIKVGQSAQLKDSKMNEPVISFDPPPTTTVLQRLLTSIQSNNPG
ncbi:hypothetical protein N9B94_03890 [Verrucomicrobia bacterium]|nr:hypothetical protein [Verrucomicrobiota bacterium]